MIISLLFILYSKLLLLLILVLLFPSWIFSIEVFSILLFSLFCLSSLFLFFSIFFSLLFSLVFLSSLLLFLSILLLLLLLDLLFIFKFSSMSFSSLSFGLFSGLYTFNTEFINSYNNLCISVYDKLLLRFISLFFISIDSYIANFFLTSNNSYILLCIIVSILIRAYSNHKFLNVYKCLLKDLSIISFILFLLVFKLLSKLIFWKLLFSLFSSLELLFIFISFSKKLFSIFSFKFKLLPFSL